MRELAKPLAFLVGSLKGSEKTLALENQSTYLEAFLDLLFHFLIRFGEESKDFLLRSVVVSISDSWVLGRQGADGETGGLDDEERGFPDTRTGEVDFWVQAARESEEEERRTGTRRGGGFSGASKRIKGP